MSEDQAARLPAVEQTAHQTAAQTWCHWHRGYADTGRLIIAVEQGSGPGVHLYACSDCRKEYRLTLWVESADADAGTDTDADAGPETPAARHGETGATA
jgi:hypothetical protein